MNKAVKKQIKSLSRDVTSLGGLPFFLFVVVLFACFNEFVFAFRLLIFLALGYIVVAAIRFVYFKERPKKKPYRNWLEKLDASSFPSLHAARTVGLAFFVADYFTVFWLSALLFCVAGLVCLSRITLKKHDFWDVAVGIVLGWLLFFLL